MVLVFGGCFSLCQWSIVHSFGPGLEADEKNISNFGVSCVNLQSSSVILLRRNCETVLTERRKKKQRTQSACILMIFESEIRTGYRQCWETKILTKSIGVIILANCLCRSASLCSNLPALLGSTDQQTTKKKKNESLGFWTLVISDERRERELHTAGLLNVNFEDWSRIDQGWGEGKGGGKEPWHRWHSSK